MALLIFGWTGSMNSSLRLKSVLGFHPTNTVLRTFDLGSDSRKRSELIFLCLAQLLPGRSEFRVVQKIIVGEGFQKGKKV